MSKTISRRKFFSNTAMSAAGLMIGTGIEACTSDVQAFQSSQSSFDIMKEVMKYRKIDAHTHIDFPEGDVDVQLDFADRLGIEKLSISRPITGDVSTHEEVIRHNDLIIKALKNHPDRFIGFFTLIPTFAKESLEEIKRCVDAGMSGYKGYLQVKVNDPSYYPVIEKLIEHKMICFMHSYSGIGRGGYRTKYGNIYPNESTPEDFIDIATRYPQVTFQWAHLGAGGDWEYQCKALKDYPNIYADTAGSNNAGNMMNYALKYFGEDRLLFASDNSYYQAVSRIFAADLTETQRKKIFFDNYNNLLRKGGYNVA